jgi:hypothetical protein
MRDFLYKTGTICRALVSTYSSAFCRRLGVVAFAIQAGSHSPSSPSSCIYIAPISTLPISTPLIPRPSRSSYLLNFPSLIQKLLSSARTAKPIVIPNVAFTAF